VPRRRARRLAAAVPLAKLTRGDGRTKKDDEG
jgi:hypothetical protein